jgi:DNA-binding transcriptional regulator LsrR (DeoR family)
MALDKNSLKNDLVAMMNNAKAQAWSEEQVATAMANAIDRYVRAGDVVGVTVKGNNLTFDQTNKGRVQ